MAQDIRALIGGWHTGVAEFLEFVEPQDPTPDRPKGKAASVKCRISVVEGPYKSTSLLWWGNLGGGARPITEKQLETMGWTGRAIKQGRGIGSTEFRFLVVEEEWNGKKSVKVKVVVPKKERADDPFADDREPPADDMPF